MTKSVPSDSYPKKLRGRKYFNLDESNSAGMDNSWQVVKRRKGYYLYNNEIGWVGDANKTICDALNDTQYAGGRVRIETNIHLEELLEIFNTHAFDPLLHNTESLTVNGAEVDIEFDQKYRCLVRQGN